MANVSRVTGFRPVKHIDGSPFNGQVNRYFAAATDGTAIFNGDLVTLAAVIDTPGQTLLGGFNATVGGTQGVTKATLGAGNACVGVAVGFMINPLNLNSPQYRTASTAMYVLVADSPDTVFEVQSQVAATPTDLNGNGTVTDAGGSTVTGFSGQYVSAYTNGATAQVKVLGAVQRVDNDITSNNYKILVTINNHQYAAGTGTAGV
ncbi:MAG TPA: hypothetical protein VJP80_08945 [Candidatus Saccharimonadales bacterium]|nr:hypothetical protein [Candidatus Saccharimonadales bacterium]